MYSERSRLNRQHEVWLETIGYCIKPSIQAQLGKDARIADIGTGTGAWLWTLSKQLPPTVTLDGYDITDIHYPPTQERPRNVTLTVADAKQPFPSEMHGRYDIVHLRMLVSAMTRDEWAIVAFHAVSLLKPGGWIQWEGPDLWNVRVLRDKTDSHTDDLRRLTAYWSNIMGERSLYGFSTLPAIYQRLGLVDIREDVVASDRLLHNRILCARVTAEGVMHDARERTAEGMPGSFSMKELDQLDRAVQSGSDTGAYTRYDMFILMGRRPLL